MSRESQRPILTEGGSYNVGDKIINSTNIQIGTDSGKLYVLEKLEPKPARVVKAQTVAEAGSAQAEARVILDSARQKLSEPEILGFYSGEEPFSVEINGQKYVVPFTNFKGDQYLQNEGRVSSLDYSTQPEYFTEDEVASYRERLIELEKSAGRRLTNGSITTVGSYDEVKNIVGVRKAGYFDIAATNNIGLDVRFKPILGSNLERDGREYETLRQIESPDGQLRSFSDSLLANVLGIGGVLITKDGYLVVPQRKVGGGVVSLDGTYGLSASGNVEWDENKLGEVGLNEFLGGRMRSEVGEEIGLNARKKGMNFSKHLLRNMELYVQKEIGLDSKKGEVLITPMAFTRDLIRGGLPQMFYLFQTSLEAAEIPERMAKATDAKKEYNQVVTLPFTDGLVASILGNRIGGMNFNQEIRAAIAYAHNSPELMKIVRK